MTYDALASGVESNRPVELYRFVQGGSTFEYTSWQEDVTVAGIPYEAVTISRGRIEQSKDSRTVKLEVELPGTNPFAIRFAASTPGSRALLTIQRYQFDDGGTPEVITIFEGYVASVAFENDDTTAKVAVTPLTAAQSRPIPRFSYQNLCNHVLYDGGCKVDETDSRFRLSAAATAFDSSTNTLTVPGAAAFGADWFTGGFVEINGGDDARLILSQSGDDLQLLLPFPENVVGSIVLVLAGCDHTIETCDTKFDTPEDPLSNVINYGGFAFVPTKNPFESGI